MKLKLTVLALSLGLSAFTAAAQMVDLGPDAKSYRRFYTPILKKGLMRWLRETVCARWPSSVRRGHTGTQQPDEGFAIHLAEAYRHFGEPLTKKLSNS